MSKIIIANLSNDMLGLDYLEHTELEQVKGGWAAIAVRVIRIAVVAVAAGSLSGSTTKE